MVPHYILSEIQKETFLTAVAHATLYLSSAYPVITNYPVPYFYLSKYLSEMKKETTVSLFTYMYCSILIEIVTIFRLQACIKLMS